jgi:plasmid stabilization system protein ParE
MRVRWTTDAADDLERICDYIAESRVTRDMAVAGVGILAGCDAMIPGFCVHDELAAMVPEA